MNPYVPLLLLFAFAALFTSGFLLVSHLLSPQKKMSLAKGSPYECGIDPVGSAREKFSVKFYLVAMLFILFDVEVVFMYPWAVLFKDFIRQGMGLFLFIEMSVFLGILAVGLLYVYGHRAIEWD